MIICYPNRITNIFNNNVNNSSINSSASLNSNTYLNIQDYPFLIYLDSFYESNPRVINIFKKYLFYEYAFKNNSCISENVNEFIQENHNKILDFTPIVKY
jgi:hypothetical protein